LRVYPPHAGTTHAVEELLDPERVTVRRERDGYLDLLGDEDPTGHAPGQRLMVSRALPLVYERIWRPLGGRVLMAGVDTAAEHARARQMLAIERGDNVLDLACGTGAFTRAFASAAGSEGVVVGVDASRTMLAQAAREGGGARYVRAGAGALPFRDASFDAVCCFAALYLIEEPYAAIDEIARVMAPGGRVALLSSVARGPLPAGIADAVVRPLTGIRIFGREDLTGALRRHGLVDVRLQMSGLAQFVSARRLNG
jgi:SAM-dependent methyltransferase